MSQGLLQNLFERGMWLCVSLSKWSLLCSEIERENVFELITQQLEFGTGLPGRKSAAIAGTKTLEVVTLLDLLSNMDIDASHMPSLPIMCCF